MANDQMQHQEYGMMQKMQENTPSAQQLLKVLSALGIGGTLMVLAGLIFAGTVVALVCATPVLVIFSPILVPVGVALFLIMAGFLSAGGVGAAALSALSWIYNYMSGKHPPGADQMEDARQRIANQARDVKERVKEFAQEVAQGA